MYIHIIFNPNQEKNILGNKVVDNSNNLNSVSNEWREELVIRGVKLIIGWILS